MFFVADARHDHRASVNSDADPQRLRQRRGELAIQEVCRLEHIMCGRDRSAAARPLSGLTEDSHDAVGEEHRDAATMAFDSLAHLFDETIEEHDEVERQLGFGQAIERAQIDEQDGCRLFHAGLEGFVVPIELAACGVDRQYDLNADLNWDVTGEDLSRWQTLMRADNIADRPFKLTGNLSSPSGPLETSLEFTSGPNRLALDGMVGAVPGFEGADLTFQAATPDLRTIAVLGQHEAIPNVAANLGGAVAYDGRAFTLRDVSLSAGNDRLEVSGVVVPEERFAGSELSGRLSIADLAVTGAIFSIPDLPSEPLSVSLDLKPVGNGLDVEVRDNDMGDTRFDIKARIPDMRTIAGLEAEFDIALPSLHLVPGTDTLPDAPLTATGSVRDDDGHSVLDKVQITVGSLQAALSGRITNASGWEGSELSIALSAPDSAVLSDILDDRMEWRIADVFPGAVNLRGDVAFVGGQGRVSAMRLELGQLRLEADGSWSEALDPAEGSFHVRATMQDVAPLSAVPALNSLAGLDQPAVLESRFSISRKRLTLDHLAASLGEVEAEVAGHLVRPFSPRDFSFDISVAGPDVSIARQWTDAELPEDPFQFSTHVSGARDEFELSGMKATLGRSDVSGDLAISLAGQVGATGTLNSDRLDLSWFLRERSDGSAVSGDGLAEPAEPEPIDDGEWLIPDSPIVTIDDTGVDLEIDYRAAVIDLGTNTFQDAHVAVRSSDRFLIVDPFELKDQDAFVRGAFSLDGTDEVPQLKAVLDGENIRIGVAAVEGEPIERYPPATIRLNLSGAGNTYRVLASSLNGKVRVIYGAGIMTSAGLRILGSDLLFELFDALNPFTESRTMTELDCAVVAADFENGAVAIAPLLFRTDAVLTTAEGVVDLNTEKIDVSFRTKPRKGLGLSAGAVVNPFIKIAGTLNSPYVELDPAGVVVSGGTAVATAGLSILAKSFSDRFLQSRDPCGDTLKDLAKRDVDEVWQ